MFLCTDGTLILLKTHRHQLVKLFIMVVTSVQNINLMKSGSVNVAWAGRGWGIAVCFGRREKMFIFPKICFSSIGE